MNRTIIVAAGLALAVALPALPAQAQNTRSFVAGSGSDSNPCTNGAPCRSFAQAITVTNAKGEIDVLDVAGYGPLTITKAISIVNDGVGTASVAVPSGYSGIGITINAGMNDAVNLRGLTIDGEGNGGTGIQLNAGGSLTITNCVIRDVLLDGINFLPNHASNLSISNTLVANNAGSGIAMTPSGSGAVTAVLDHVEVDNNASDGIAVNGSSSSGTVNVTLSDSVVAGTTNTALYVTTDTLLSEAPTTLMVFHSVAANNGTGIEADGAGAVLRVGQSTVTENSTGYDAASSGVIDTFGDNYFSGNSGNSGSLTMVSRQ
jgi:hypothetical protein